MTSARRGMTAILMGTSPPAPSPSRWRGENTEHRHRYGLERSSRTRDWFGPPFPMREGGWGVRRPPRVPIGGLEDDGGGFDAAAHRAADFRSTARPLAIGDRHFPHPQP